MQLKKDAVVSHSLALINNGSSTVTIKLSTDENHFSVAGVTLLLVEEMSLPFFIQVTVYM